MLCDVKIIAFFREVSQESVAVACSKLIILHCEFVIHSPELNSLYLSNNFKRSSFFGAFYRMSRHLL